jgi:4-hydroxy-3-polyprenylbenzoate decarboxylase
VAVGALAGNEEIYALGLMCKPEEIMEKRADAETHPIEPKLIDVGPLQEEVHIGDSLL